MRRASSRTPVRARARPGIRASLAVILVVAAGLTQVSCGTGGLAVKRDIWEAEEGFERRQAGLSEKVLRLEGRILALEEEVVALRYELSQVSTDVAGLDSDFARGLEAVRDGQQQLGVELENQIRSVDSGRAEDRQDILGRIEIILDEVTRENERLRGDIEALRSSMAAGYTHEVKRGETLAQIAAQYGVTVGDIAAANGITNPNIISVGQELIIPQR